LGPTEPSLGPTGPNLDLIGPRKLDSQGQSQAVNPDPNN
jgi:hypothetical protein